MNQAPRKFHHRIAPWLVLPLFVMLATGVAYRVGRAWFGLSKDAGKTLLHIHTGEWMGSAGSAVWIVLVGLGLLTLALTGLALVIKSRAKGQPRVFHRILGSVLLLPLAATALTGLIFHFGEDELPESTGDLLMRIHQGGWLGKSLCPVYVLLLGSGLLIMIVSGLLLTRAGQKFRLFRAG